MKLCLSTPIRADESFLGPGADWFQASLHLFGQDIHTLLVNKNIKICIYAAASEIIK